MKIYTGVFLTSIRTEQRRSNVMTSAGVQHFCKEQKKIKGCFVEFRV